MDRKDFVAGIGSKIQEKKLKAVGVDTEKIKKQAKPIVKETVKQTTVKSSGGSGSGVKSPHGSSREVLSKEEFVSELASKEESISKDITSLKQQEASIDTHGMYWVRENAFSKPVLMKGSQLKNFYNQQEVEYKKAKSDISSSKSQAGSWHPETKVVKTDQGYDTVFPYAGAENYKDYKERLDRGGVGGLLATAFTGEDPLGLASAYYMATGEKQKAIDVKIKSLHHIKNIKSPVDAASWYLNMPVTQIGFAAIGAYGVGKAAPYVTGMVARATGAYGATVFKTGLAAGSIALAAPTGKNIIKQVETGQTGEAFGNIAMLGFNLAAGYAGYKAATPSKLASDSLFKSGYKKMGNILSNEKYKINYRELTPDTSLFKKTIKIGDRQTGARFVKTRTKTKLINKMIKGKIQTTSDNRGLYAYREPVLDLKRSYLKVKEASGDVIGTSRQIKNNVLKITYKPGKKIYGMKQPGIKPTYKIDFTKIKGVSGVELDYNMNQLSTRNLGLIKTKIKGIVQTGVYKTKFGGQRFTKYILLKEKLIKTVPKKIYSGGYNLIKPIKTIKPTSDMFTKVKFGQPGYFPTSLYTPVYIPVLTPKFETNIKKQNFGNIKKINKPIPKTITVMSQLPKTTYKNIFTTKTSFNTIVDNVIGNIIKPTTTIKTTNFLEPTKTTTTIKKTVPSYKPKINYPNIFFPGGSIFGHGRRVGGNEIWGTGYKYRKFKIPSLNQIDKKIIGSMFKI